MGATVEDWCEVARSDDLVGAGPWAVSAGDLHLVLVLEGGEFRAFDGLCPHRGALLGEGEHTAGQLICRSHGWRFSTASGERDGGAGCLTRYPLRHEEGRICVQVGSRTEPKPRTGRRWHDLPGPRGLPALGSAPFLGRKRIHARLEQWAEAHGPFCGFRVGSTPVFLISDAHLTGQALSARPASFRRLKKLDGIFSELGLKSVLTAEGDEWRRQRRLASSALSPSSLSGFYPVLLRATERLLHDWQHKAHTGEEFAIEEDFLRFTAEVVSTLAFGRDVAELGGIQEKIATILRAINRRLKALVPYWRFFALPRDRELDQAFREVRRWMSEVVEQTRAAMAEDPERSPRNFLEAMLAASDDQGRPFDEPAILGNALTMLFAGEELTGSTLAWVVHHLCEAPEAVTRLREEADRVLQDDTFAADIATTRELRYTDAVVHEAMRVRPVVPFFLMEAIRDTALGDLDIRAGEVVIGLYRKPGMRDEVTPDAERFSPERWLDPAPEARSRLQAVHMPFGGGPRTCPGRSLALLETRVVLSMLYRNFEVERVGDPEDVQETFQFAAVAPQGLRVRLRPRRRAEPRDATSGTGRECRRR